MANNTTINKLSLVSVACVFVWNKTFVNIPPLDRTKGITLFNRPELTYFEYIPQSSISIGEVQIVEPPKDFAPGMVINIASAVMPRVNLNSQRYELYGPTIESVVVTNSAFLNLMEEQSPNFLQQIIPYQLGVNLEVEVEIEGIANSADWLNGRLGLCSNDNVKSSLTDLRIRFDESNSKFAMVTLQPRFNNLEAFFVSVNDHYSFPPINGFPAAEELEKIVNLTIDKIKTVYIPFIINKK